MFNLEREVLTCFSPYPMFEPRTLQAFEAAQTNFKAPCGNHLQEFPIIKDHD